MFDIFYAVNHFALEIVFKSLRRNVGLQYQWLKKLNYSNCENLIINSSVTHILLGWLFCQWEVECLDWRWGSNRWRHRCSYFDCYCLAGSNRWRHRCRFRRIRRGWKPFGRRWEQLSWRDRWPLWTCSPSSVDFGIGSLQKNS